MDLLCIILAVLILTKHVLHHIITVKLHTVKISQVLFLFCVGFKVITAGINSSVFLILSSGETLRQNEMI